MSKMLPSLKNKQNKYKLISLESSQRVILQQTTLIYGLELNHEMLCNRHITIRRRRICYCSNPLRRVAVDRTDINNS